MTVLPIATVETRLRRLVERLGKPRVTACCPGAAGVDTEGSRRQLSGVLEGLLPDARVEVVHDTRLILAAAGLESGTALIAGTGSVAYARSPSGQESRAGGWGWLLGDEGSGAWVVREAARELFRRADAGEPPGALGGALFAAAGVSSAAELGRELHRRLRPDGWAGLAGAVFGATGADPGARRIVSRAGAALAALAAGLPGQGPLVLAGGLVLNHPELEQAVREAVGERFPVVVRLEEPPVAGAVRLALQSA